MNIRAALAYGRRQLSPADSAQLDARLLLIGLLDASHSYLIAHDDQELTADQEVVYRRWLEEAARGCPVPYLLGEAPFYGRTFQVSPAVLIPRPETEMLVEAARRWAADLGAPTGEGLRLVDVGTGSGCLAITLALELPAARVTAVDISPAALAIAQANGRRHGFAPDSARLQFVQSDLLTAVAAPVDLIAANLPYVAESEWTSLPDGVKLYEPALALKGGVDGLDLIRQLLIQANDRLNRPGAILLEIGWRQGRDAAQLAGALCPDAQVMVKKDLADHDRLVMIAIV
jgi:release factor glutamine methyltransferase